MASDRVERRGCGICIWCREDLPPCPWRRTYWRSANKQSGWVHHQQPELNGTA